MNSGEFFEHIDDFANKVAAISVFAEPCSKTTQRQDKRTDLIHEIYQGLIEDVRRTSEWNISLTESTAPYICGYGHVSKIK